MRTVFILSVTLLGLVIGCTDVSAENLVQIYNQAIKNDQTFQQAESTFLSNKQLTPIARAALLPQIEATAAYNPYNYKYGVSTVKGYGSYSSFTYGLQLTQSLFNFSSWQALAGARSGVRAAEATYFAASQTLIYETAQAYFGVLEASDKLRYTIASARAFLHQLKTQREKYKVGLVAITDVYNAQSQYDAALAQEIADRSAVSNALETLRVTTGHSYKSLQTISGEVPLIPPQPNSISMWVSKSGSDNYLIKAAEYKILADKSKIKQDSYSRFPTVAAGAGFNQTINSNEPISGSKDGRLTTLGFSLDFKPYQGGLVVATVKQDRYNFLTDSAALELQHRNVTSQARKSFLGVVSGISQLEADLVSIKSFRKNYEATQAGFIAGTQTEVVVLQSLSDLYQAQTQYTNDEYAYILSSLQLKQASGTLGLDDLVAINKWLKAKLIFQPRGDGNYTVIFPQEKSSTARSDKLPTIPGLSPPPDSTVKSSTKSDQKTKVVAKKKQVSSSMKKTAGLQSFYTIQLFASNYEQSAFDFKNHLLKDGKFSKLQPNNILIISKLSGKYKITYGQYASLKQASDQLRKLPKALKNLHPWITHADADNIVGSATPKTQSIPNSESAVTSSRQQSKKWPFVKTSDPQSWPLHGKNSTSHPEWPLHNHQQPKHKSISKTWPLPAPGSYKIPPYHPATSAGWPLNGKKASTEAQYHRYDKVNKAWPLPPAGSYKVPPYHPGTSDSWPLSGSSSQSSTGGSHSTNKNAPAGLPAP